MIAVLSCRGNRLHNRKSPNVRTAAKEESMNRTIHILATLSFLALMMPYAAGKTVVIDKNDTVKTYDCEGSDASIEGNRNTVTLSHCSQVTVIGNYNHVTLAEDCPDLAVPGNYNQVAAGQVKKINTMGNDNTVTWTSPKEDDRPSVSNLANVIPFHA